MGSQSRLHIWEAVASKVLSSSHASVCHHQCLNTRTDHIVLYRSFGDADLKPALTAQPVITQRQLSREDEFVILASDGLWDKLHIEEAVGLVLDTVKQPAMAAQRFAANKNGISCTSNSF